MWSVNSTWKLASWGVVPEATTLKRPLPWSALLMMSRAPAVSVMVSDRFRTMAWFV